jgi:hypothetical protein
MRQVRCVVGVVVMACTLAGCGDSPPESGPVQYKATQNSPEIEAFAKRLSEQQAKGKPGMKKPEAPSKAVDAKAETKKE